MKALFVSTLMLIPTSYAMASASTVDTGFGEVYADDTGKSLYTFAKDPSGNRYVRETAKRYGHHY